MLTVEAVDKWLHEHHGTRIYARAKQYQFLIERFGNSVYLFEDKMFLSFNYKGGQKTITFSDIKGSDLITRGAPK